MQWRCLVLGLLLLRLALYCFLWFGFGLGPSPSLGFYRRFPFAAVWGGQPGVAANQGVCRQSYGRYFVGAGDDYGRRYSSFPAALRAQMRELARGMFVFGYDNYMRHAFPEDELNPIDCQGRGPDTGNPYGLHWMSGTRDSTEDPTWLVAENTASSPYSKISLDDGHSQTSV